MFQKPLLFIIKTNFGVDDVDQMARKYNAKAGSFRWPLQVFLNILDLAAINAWILCKECTGSKISRKEYIFCLAEELAGENKENICQRSDASFLSPSTSEVRKSCQMGYCKKKIYIYIEAIIVVYIAKEILCGKYTNKIQYICKKCVQ